MPHLDARAVETYTRHPTDEMNESTVHVTLWENPMGDGSSTWDVTIHEVGPCIDGGSQKVSLDCVDKDAAFELFAFLTNKNKVLL